MMRHLLISAALPIILSLAIFTQDTVRRCLSGTLGPSIYVAYPMMNDSSLVSTRYSILYPLLVVNDIPLRDTIAVNHFRNHFSKDMVLGNIKFYTQQKGIAQGYKDCPPDGVLIVKLRKKPLIMPILHMSSEEASHFNTKYGLSQNIFDFTDKNVCLFVSNNGRDIEKMIGRTGTESHPQVQLDQSRLFILNDKQRDAIGYDAIIWYNSK